YRADGRAGTGGRASYHVVADVTATARVAWDDSESFRSRAPGAPQPRKGSVWAVTHRTTLTHRCLSLSPGASQVSAAGSGGAAHRGLAPRRPVGGSTSADPSAPQPRRRGRPRRGRAAP